MSIFLDHVLRRLYVAIGDPGLIEVFDIDRLERVDVVETEPGAHTDRTRRRATPCLRVLADDRIEPPSSRTMADRDGLVYGLVTGTTGAPAGHIA